MLWLFVVLVTLGPAHSITFRTWFTLNIYSDNTGGNLVEVQDKTFGFHPNGTINVDLVCNDDSYEIWKGHTEFNVFLCEEQPKTRWLYLYPIWGMCFDSPQMYHHCTIDKLQKTGPMSWSYNATITSTKNIVARIRSCPIYNAGQLKKLRTRNLQFGEAQLLSHRYSCEFTGVFLNNGSRLSYDEDWNPYIFGVLTIIYGILVLKGVFEVFWYWHFSVKCSYYVYATILLKFMCVLMTFLYYKRILTESDFSEGYMGYMFIIALFTAGKFTAYYLTLLALGSGYCIYTAKGSPDKKFQITLGTLMFVLWFYLMVLNDSYVEVPVVIIVSAAYAAMLAIFWAYHFKKLLYIRYEFEHRRNDECTIAKEQLKKKELMVGVAFGEVICFLAYIIIYEFYRSDSYPIPGMEGVLACESIEFALLFPLTVIFNMRDLSRYYPAPRPPPLVHVIDSPDGGMQVSISERPPRSRARRSDNQGSRDSFHDVRNRQDRSTDTEAND